MTVLAVIIALALAVRLVRLVSDGVDELKRLRAIAVDEQRAPKWRSIAFDAVRELELGTGSHPAMVRSLVARVALEEEQRA